MTNDKERRNEEVGTEEQITDAGTQEQETVESEVISETAEETSELQKCKSQAEEYLQMAQRVQADFDNFRRRTAQERADWSKYCSQRLATNLLPILDNFERALQAGGDDLNSFRGGIELIYRQFKEALEKDGIKAMEAVGTEFDPNFHEAVMQGPSDDYPDNTVIEEFQKGYMLADRILRPAMVKVAKN